jgi:hypothetical protein
MTGRIKKASALAAAWFTAGLVVLGLNMPPAYAVGSVSMTTAPTATISGWTLAYSGSNTTAAGTLGVTATTAYTVTVQADMSRLTEWITASSSYATNPKTLGSALSVLTSLTSGLGVPVSPVAVGTSASTIATGVTGTDTYALTLSQPTSISDPALVSGHTYHIVLTYTASATI